MYNKIISLLIALMFCFGFAIAQPNYNVFDYSTNNQNSLSGYVLYVPAGFTTKVVLSQGINSNSAVVGQGISAILSEDLLYNGNLVAPYGSVVQGSIVQVSKAKYGDINAKIMVKFTTIMTPYNNVIPISAVIATSDNSGLLKGGATIDSVKEYAKDTAIGASTGAVLGTAMGALSSGSVGKGAIYGTALGAGMGIIKNASNKGADVVIPANSEIDIYFNQPITLGGK